MKKFIWMLAMVFAMGQTASADTSVPFKTLAQKPATLQQYLQQGKWTIVMIWSNFCHVCNEEADKYNAFHAKHKAKNAQVVGLSVDGKLKDAKSFVTRHKLNFPNLLGNDQSVAQLYLSESGQQFFATPSFMIYDDKGKLRAVQAGAVPPEVIEKFMKNPEAF